MGKSVAIVGATGAVGRTMAKVIEEKNLNITKIGLFASKRSIGKKINIGSNEIIVEKTEIDKVSKYDYCLLAVDSKLSQKLAPELIKKGTIVIDNSSAFRLDHQVPLVVPEVNPQKAYNHKGIISNPNCSTIQMVLSLYPIHSISPIQRVVVSTYQSASGAGQKAVDELKNCTENVLNGVKCQNEAFIHPIAFSAIPHIDSFDPSGYTKEELKMSNETQKIMNSQIKVSATCVRIPTINCHCESINIQTKNKVTVTDALKAYEKFPSVKVWDNPKENIYPLPPNVDGYDDVFIGRIRQDKTIENGLNIWSVADNLRKGAATNAVQILELLI
ncbi:aspartate-semialdehyde dehydrogenase [Proteinivorax hydrogeniformans]|uniref:Aspartate-semialdehyde dehydrogenase n=1 Tax=Proteinivorax hydrogeniformans TaxID=1826727 RepID=A0AAU8HQV8_9FIRM